jgi:hypothetical protein
MHVAGYRIVDDRDTAHGGGSSCQIRSHTEDESLLAQRSIRPEAMRGQAGEWPLFRLAERSG